jgi:hypothetical protein
MMNPSSTTTSVATSHLEAQDQSHGQDLNCQCAGIFQRATSVEIGSIFVADSCAKAMHAQMATMQPSINSFLKTRVDRQSFYTGSP